MTSQFIKRLGEGTFAIVNLHKKDTGEHVVIKKLKTRHHYNHASLMFKNECRIIANLNHPNIRRLYNYTDNTMTLEYCPGIDMFEYIDTKSKSELTLDLMIHYYFQLIDAVDYLHSKNIAHLDIKLENIMLNELTHKILLIDFGHAVDSKFVYKLGGTHPYIAPEGFYKNKIDPLKGDIWSLGVILYEFIHGNYFPWEYSNEIDNVFATYALTEKLYIKSDIPEYLCLILKGTLKPNPELRFTINDIINLKV
jgi:serine/threonine protein kinase